jgi:hypothetical protein
MKLADIPRVKAGATLASTSEITEIGGERAKLAVRAANLLGYRRLADDVAGRQSLGLETGKLADTLRGLDFAVLDAASVITYQIEEAGRRTREAITENFSNYVAGWFSAAGWTHTDLTAYERPIPEFVLDKAIRLKEVLPEVRFVIQHMTDPKADPFLVAMLGKEIYFVDAWDEPRFEVTL